MTGIRQAIKKLAREGSGEVYSVVGTVIAIDEPARTCDVQPSNGDADIYGVRLQASLDQKDGWCLVPAKGAEVVVTFLNKTTGYIGVCSKIDKAILKIEDTEWTVDKAGYSIKRQNESMKKILSDLISAIEKLTVTTAVGPSGVPINMAEFTAIKQRLNNLLT